MGFLEINSDENVHSLFNEWMLSKPPFQRFLKGEKSIDRSIHIFEMLPHVTRTVIFISTI